MFDSLGTLITAILGVIGMAVSVWLGRKAYTTIKADRDRIASNQAAIDAAMKRLAEARRKATSQTPLDANKRDAFDRQP